MLAAVRIAPRMGLGLRAARTAAPSLSLPASRVLSSATTSEQFVEANGAKLLVLTAGDNAAAPPLLCMPGAMGTAETDWGPQLGGSLAAARRLVATDPRGYGRSRPPARRFPADYYHIDAADAAAVMDQLGHKTYVRSRLLCVRACVCRRRRRAPSSSRRSVGAPRELPFLPFTRRGDPARRRPEPRAAHARLRVVVCV